MECHAEISCDTPFLIYILTRCQNKNGDIKQFIMQKGDVSVKKYWSIISIISVSGHNIA